MKKNTRNKKKFLLFLIILSIIIPTLIFTVTRFEGEEPAVNIDLLLSSIGTSGEMSLTVSDQKSGLKHAWFALSKDGKEEVLETRDYPSEGFPKKGTKKADSFKILIEPKKLGFKDGPAMIRIRVSDYSWRNWFSGNVTYIEKKITIDTRPPEIDVLTRNHNLKKGGTGLIAYKLTGGAAKSGVVVGDNFFPGYPGYFTNPDIYIAFFALNHKQGPGTNLYIEAFDEAGNRARAGFNHYIGNRIFKKDAIRLSDGFLRAHMPSFQYAEETFESDIDKFLYINRKIRKENGDKIFGAGKNPDTAKHWKGKFTRLPGSANRAGYADHRRYIYKGKVVDNQYHLGVDLASVRQAEVPAGNAGRIALVDSIGIYGKTVIIDHGFGLFTTYSHLSSVNVTEGEQVKKGAIIGRTGVTGLVGGDHLHYGMFVHNIFVNPIEWWDTDWIENNITSKLDAVQNMYQ